MSRNTTALWTLVAAFAVGGVAANAKEATLTGKVGDAMCGVKHMMADEAGCTRGCVKKGADYALIVKDKVYTLKTSNDAAKGQLDKLAGKMAKITGDQTGDTIQVASVQSAK
jgi:hypothetical protein